MKSNIFVMNMTLEEFFSALIAFKDRQMKINDVKINKKSEILKDVDQGFINFYLSLNPDILIGN